ncbi:hypothetical protein BCL69_10153 [Nitrosomonas communis]|uniref:Uncharacterized protein n=1 Tax=Nitrosomonas communis TaxID=44574 RepID=A0A1H2ZXC3_9PROT|nr:hypothetical protein BCL69_10153 [Nitrosomonas communis]SDX21299.1 hypothetical protein SAMN05421882_10953 [Nitrosomonas communis]
MGKKIFFRNYLTCFYEVECVQSFSKDDIKESNAYDFLKWIGDIQEVETETE